MSALGLLLATVSPAAALVSPALMDNVKALLCLTTWRSECWMVGWGWPSASLHAGQVSPSLWQAAPGATVAGRHAWRSSQPTWLLPIEVRPTRFSNDPGRDGDATTRHTIVVRSLATFLPSQIFRAESSFSTTACYSLSLASLAAALVLDLSHAPVYRLPTLHDL